MSLEYDLAMRIDDFKISTHSKNTLLSSLYTNTNLPELFKNIPSLPMDIRRYVLSMNINIPEEIYFNISCDVFNKAFKSQKSKPIPQTKLEDLKLWSCCTTFREEDYDFLIKNYTNERELFFELSSSDKTPSKILDKIIEKFKEKLLDNNSTKISQSFDIRTIALALSTKAFLSGKINKKEHIFLTNRISSVEFAPTIEEYDKLNDFRCSIMGYKETLKSILDDRKDEKFADVVRDIFVSDDENILCTSHLKVFCDYLEQTIIPFTLDHSDTREPITKDNISDMSDDRLAFESRKFFEIAILGNSLVESGVLTPDFYLKIDDFIETYNLVTTERERRKTLKEPVQEIER